jgi:cytochrome c biogenesis protein CcmG/thiol:disulfide interchange protein DsbE
MVMREKGAFMIWRTIFKKRLSLIGLIWVVLISLLLPHAANPKSDNPLDLIFLDTKGHEVRLKELAENKPLLLYFWATWCKPCRKTQPEVSALAKKYKDRIKVVGINVGGLDSGRDIEKYSSRKKITYTMLLDRADQAVKTYSIYAIPTIILLNESGKILFRDNKVPKDLEKFLSG